MKKFTLLFSILPLIAGSPALWAQAAPRPTIPMPPTYDYTEANGCAGCHFIYGARAAHMPEAVGVIYDAATNNWKLTGRGWLSSRHAQTNYVSTQNTFCSKCHSPLQAAPAATMFSNERVPDGKMEGVTCAACHPSHTAAVTLGRRLGIYQWGKDKNTAAAYQAIPEGQEDLLCLNCHVERHNEDNPAFRRMYEAEVRCIDCHMPVIGYTPSGSVEKRAHDFRVAANLPYSCGAQGSIIQCHPSYTADEMLSYIPTVKEQHKDWWPQGQSH